MANIETIYHHLSQFDDVTIDRAMAAALATADPDAQRRMVQLLLNRQHHEGCAGLVVHYHLFDDDLQQKIDDHATALSRSIRLAAAMQKTEGPANAIQIIRQSQSLRMAYLVTDQLRSGSRDLGSAAAGCLKFMAHRVAKGGPGGRRPTSGGEVGDLITAVQEAVIHYAAHEQEEVLLAWCWLKPRPTVRACSALGDIEHAAVGPMRRLLAEGDDAAVRRALLGSLSVGTLVEPALAGLRRCCASRTLGEAIEQVHLLQQSAVARPLLRLESPQTLWPDAQQIAHMTGVQQRALPCWLDALGFNDDDRAARLMDLCRAGDTATRLAALRRLLAIARRSEDGAFDDAITRLTDDADVQIARLAASHLIHGCSHDLARILTTLVNSTHPQIRKLVARRLAPIGFTRLWEHWHQMSLPQRLAAGRALIKIDPNFHRLLGEQLTHRDRKARVRAMGMINELHQGSFFTKALAQLARDGDEFVASAAVTALGSCEGEETIKALRGALDHADSRVRANAVESLDRLESADHVQELVRIAREDQNRPRANAIAALMQLSAAEALAALRRMLDDPRANHRQSALWLVDTLGLFDVARSVAEMSISDPDKQTRDRAEHTVHGLIRQMSGPAIHSDPVSKAS